MASGRLNWPTLLLLLALPAAISVDRTLFAGESGSQVVDAVTHLIQQACLLPDDHRLLRRIAFVETLDGTDPRTYSGSNSGGIWQVDPSMLRATKNGGASLNAAYQKIKDYFGIDWATVTDSDLRKPLYSGLAAALYVIIQSSPTGAIPVNPESQAAFLQSHYDNSLTPYNYTLQINDIPTGCDQSGVLDLAFLVDGTMTDDDFFRTKSEIARVVAKLPNLPDRVHVAFMQFSTGMDQEFRLDVHSLPSDIANAITAAKHTSGGANSETFPASTAAAVRFAVDNIFPPSKGGRESAAKLILVVTDTVPQDAANLVASYNYAFQHGIGIYGLTIGHTVRSELTPLITPPTCVNHMHVEDFRELKFLDEQLLSAICNAPRYTNKAVYCELEHCPGYAFLSTINGITLSGNVTCGSTNLFASYNDINPGQTYYSLMKTLQPGRTEQFFLQPSLQSQQFLYVRLPHEGLSSPGCIASLIPHEGNTIDTTTHVMCNNGGRDWECNGTDLPKRLVDEICNGTVFRYPPNPCNANNLANGDLKFPDPYDTRKFIECDLQGRMYVTQCPEGEVYSEDCQYCRGPNSPVLTGCGQETPEHLQNPCTAQHILAGQFFFEYPGDETLYIQCDVWGHAFVRHCQRGFVWRQEGLTCEPTNKYNPCSTPDPHNNRFFPHPNDTHRFIECKDRVPYIMACPYLEIWLDVEKTCGFVNGAASVPNMITQLFTARFSTLRPLDSGTVVHPGLECSHEPYKPPCTWDNIQSGSLFHPHWNPHNFIQCDTSGNCYTGTCKESGDTYDPFSHTCVDGPVHVDCPDITSPDCIHP